MDAFEQAIVRGREDPEFWMYFFLGERLHEGQLEWLQNAEAQVNVGCTANRWGKSTVQVMRHFHRCFYKLGGEHWYVKDGELDLKAYRDLRYETLHTAQGWDTAEIVWREAFKYTDKPNLMPFISKKPKSIPPYIEFTNGAVWRFRTMGPDGQGIDGKSYYLVTIDEAGWVANLDAIVNNVARVRTADVQGCVDLMGTFKPGVSRAFYGFAKKAGAYTGSNLEFDFEDWQKQQSEEEVA